VIPLRQSVRLGIIGFGKLAREYYVPALRHLRDARVTAVADPLPASRREAERRFPGVVVGESGDEIIERGAADALLVASPPSTHLEIWRRAAARGLPAFVEKPLFLPGQLAAFQPASDAGRLLMVNFNRRFWPAYQKLAGLARSGRIGKPEQAEFALHTDILRWCSVTQHRLSPAEGGALYDVGSQMVDLALALADEEPIAVGAEADSKRWPQDHVRLRLRFANGIEARCHLAYEQYNRERVSVRGSLGVLRIEDPNRMLLLDTGVSAAERLAHWVAGTFLLGARAIARDRSMLRYTVRRAIEAFVRSVRTGEPFWPGLEEALRVARCLEAARRSLETGRMFTLEPAGRPAAQ